MSTLKMVLNGVIFIDMEQAKKEIREGNIAQIKKLSKSILEHKFMINHGMGDPDICLKVELDEIILHDLINEI